MEENGIDLAKMDIKLLEKVEELTLYLIENTKQNEKIKKDIEALLKENKRLKEDMERLQR